MKLTTLLLIFSIAAFAQEKPDTLSIKINQWKIEELKNYEKAINELLTQRAKLVEYILKDNNVTKPVQDFTLYNDKLLILFKPEDE